MKFDVITLFPEMINNYCASSIIGRAQKEDVISVNTYNPRDYSKDKHKRVDDTPYGGGAGMVLACDPIFSALDDIEKLPDHKKILLTPQGKPFDQQAAVDLSSHEQLIFICGHYEGFDERIRQNIDVVEISIGDFVLTGGELAALCIIDSVSRNLEGALGKIESAHYDTFSDGLLEYPQYTRPYEYNGHKVPDILLSGDHKKVADWRREQQILRTYNKRPDMFEKFISQELSKQDKIIVDKILNEDK